MPLPDHDQDITDTVLRERDRLGSFIRRRMRDKTEAEDILQDVFHEFVQAYRLPEPIEQVSAWLFRVARNRIIDRFRKRKELALDGPGGDCGDAGDDERQAIQGSEASADNPYRLDLVMPAPDAGPEAAYARSVLLRELQLALEELPETQREVFIAHELDGISFKQMAARSGVPLNTLLARKRYAVQTLRKRLHSVYDEFDQI